MSEADLRRAEEIAFPFAIIALLLVFRSVIAAALPAAIGGCSVVISLALLYLLARVIPVSIFALNITTLFGLGLGVDYSLFMVSRFREELRRGHTVSEAIGMTMSTAGRAVFFSGLTVSIGLLGLLLFPLNVLRSVGIGGSFDRPLIDTGRGDPSAGSAQYNRDSYQCVTGGAALGPAGGSPERGLWKRGPGSDRLLAPSGDSGHATSADILATGACHVVVAWRAVLECTAFGSRRLDTAHHCRVSAGLRHIGAALRPERQRTHHHCCGNQRQPAFHFQPRAAG